jgi:hypothetical protein
MRIEKSQSEGAHEVFSLRFEQSGDNGLHEAYVALNAIAARNRNTFEEVLGSNAEDTGKLADATKELLESGIDKFVAEVQRLGREKARESVLTATVGVKATKDNLKYLHTALSDYRDNTGMAVVSEMRNAMGNQAGLSRTFEMVTADTMAHVIEGATEIIPALPADRQPFGFERALLTSYEA